MTSISYHKGQRVQVKERGGGIRWFDATAIDVQGRGCIVELRNGRKEFFHWNSIRPAPGTFEPKPKPEAKLGDVLRKDLEKVLDKMAAPEAPKPSTPPLKSPASPVSRPYLDTTPKEAPVTKEALERAEEARVENDGDDEWQPPPEEPLKGAKKPLPPGFGEKGKPRVLPPRARARPRTPTAIGDAMRAIRLERGLTQAAISDRMSCNRARYIDLESGDAIPKEEEVVAFANAIGEDPEPLRQVRNTSWKQHEDLLRQQRQERAQKRVGKRSKKHLSAVEKRSRLMERLGLTVDDLIAYPHLSYQEIAAIKAELESKSTISDTDIKQISEQIAALPPPQGVAPDEMSAIPPAPPLQLPAAIKIKYGGLEIEASSVEEAARLAQLLKQ